MRGTRAGMSLLEIMVVIAIMGAAMAISIPSLNAVFDVEQRSAARQLASTYSLLISEATLRNVSFRIAYNLDRRSYKIEVGDPNTLVFGSPESRLAWEEEQEDKLKMFTKREIKEGKADDMLDSTDSKFAGLTAPGFDADVELPTNCAFAWAYTPQYGEPIAPSEKEPEDPSEEHIVYSYIFANGTAEYTVIRIVDMNAPDDGYTIEVEPLSGKVTIDENVTEIGASMSWMPDEAPSIQ